MGWFNMFGLVLIFVIMIPNIIFGIKVKNGFENNYKNKVIECIEQIGRVSCIGFLIFNIPGTWFGCWSDEVFAIYLIGDILLCFLYCIIWVICWKKNNVFKALAFSIIPSVIFLFSGIMSRSILLIFATLLFAPTHIFISYKNYKFTV